MSHSLKEKIIFAIACVIAIALPLFAQTQIYRSTQYGKTSALKTGAGINLTISGTTATFASAMPDTVGVGDAIQYDATGLGTITNICFISARTSSTVYTVQDAAGGAPTACTNDQDWSIFRAYTSWANVESGTENTGINVTVRGFDAGNENLSSANENWNVACYRGYDTDDIDIAGWTFGTNNRLNFYSPTSSSEVGVSQRHVGYYVGSTATAVNKSGILTLSGASIEVQLSINGVIWHVNNVSCNAMNIALGTSASLFEVFNSILIGRNGSGCSSSQFGIGMTSYAGTSKIRNCIFYNFDGSGNNSGVGSHSAVITSGGGGTMYISNCTFSGCNYSIQHANGTMVAKNIVSQATDTDGFFATGGASFHADSDYNLSERPSDAPGANSKNGVTVFFENVDQNNFHLENSDVVAGNSGVDLASDSNLPVTTDIDGAARPTGSNTVDMGADEGVADGATAEAAAQIYRSTQYGKTSALKVGTGINLTISGTTATFASAMPDTVGVGDAIQYDSDANGTIDKICFISARTSSTVYTVQNSTGDTPTACTNDQDWSIFRAYTSWANVLVGTENTGISANVVNFDTGNENIAGLNENWNVACYRGFDTDNVAITGWFFGANNRLNFYSPTSSSEVGLTQRHAGLYPGATASAVNKSGIITFGTESNQQASFVGIIYHVDAINCQLIAIGNGASTSLIEFYNNVAIGRNGVSCSGTSSGIEASAFSGVLKVKNCIFYNFDGSSNNSGAGNHTPIRFLGTNATIYAYNNTDYNSNYSFFQAATSGTFVVKNNISQNSDSFGFFTSGGASYSAASDYNLSDRAADAPGANSKNSTTVTFVNAASNNFHLNSGDTGAGNSGTDLSADANLTVTTDIDGGDRPTGSNTVDMGADEGVVTAAEMDVKGNNTSITDGDATPSASDSTDFGSVLTTSATRSVTYTISNTGETALTLSGTPKVAVGGTHAADFTVTTQPSSPVSAAGSVTFVVSFDPSATGTRSATLSIANDDSDENPYNWSIQGTGVTREIAVSGNSQDITNGDATPSPADGTDFGRIALVNATQTVVFTISNSGASTLTLSGTPKVAVSGANSSDFTVTAQPSSPIAGSGSTTFTVVFDPSGVGLRTATLSIANDDSDENPFTFSVSGVGSSGRHNSFGQFHFGQHTRY